MSIKRSPLIRITAANLATATPALTCLRWPAALGTLVAALLLGSFGVLTARARAVSLLLPLSTAFAMRVR